MISNAICDMRKEAYYMRTDNNTVMPQERFSQLSGVIIVRWMRFACTMSTCTLHLLLYSLAVSMLPVSAALMSPSHSGRHVQFYAMISPVYVCIIWMNTIGARNNAQANRTQIGARNKYTGKWTTIAQNFRFFSPYAVIVESKTAHTDHKVSCSVRCDRTRLNDWLYDG